MYLSCEAVIDQGTTLLQIIHGKGQFWWQNALPALTPMAGEQSDL